MDDDKVIRLAVDNGKDEDPRDMLEREPPLIEKLRLARKALDEAIEVLEATVEAAPVTPEERNLKSRDAATLMDVSSRDLTTLARERLIPCTRLVTTTPDPERQYRLSRQELLDIGTEKLCEMRRQVNRETRRRYR